VSPSPGLAGNGQRSSTLPCPTSAENGDLLWYQYNGKGESNLGGSFGWSPNSGNAIGNGW
jgi:hypothetical protein